MNKTEWPRDPKFNEWWNGEMNDEDNPYNEGTPAYWAWQGWLAGRAAQKDEDAKLCNKLGRWHSQLVTAAYDHAADAIRDMNRVAEQNGEEL
jgi:hypothetical protein